MRIVTVLLLMAASAWATVRHVPGDYPTIQGALDSVQERDTVLVDSGVYAESLLAPPVSFVLKGNVIADTGDFPRPVIDPTSLPGSDSLFCLYLSGGDSVTLENMAFRNGAAMYPRRANQGSTTSGIRSYTLHLMANHCFFDSTECGILGLDNCAVDVKSCHFVYVSSSVTMENQRRAIVSDCLFEHCSGWAHVMGGDGSQVIRCRFGGNPWTYLCDLYGRHLSVHDCVFGPSLPGEASWDPALMLSSHPAGIIENNIFQGLRLGEALITVVCACDDSDILTIRHNRFVGNVVETYNGNANIEIQRAPSAPPGGRCGVEIDSNVFEDNHCGRTSICMCQGIFFWNTDGRAVGNQFRHLRRDSVFYPLIPATILTRPPQGLVLRSNRFDSTGRAVAFFNNMQDTLDARWNWWGDSTGPYEAINHPQGYGDTVAVGTDFTPWCTDTLTCEEPTTANYRFSFHPSAFILSAYPNPFNSTTILRLRVPHAEIVRVELFDILGRRVRELWAGAVADEEEIVFDGSALASGVYFVRVTNTIWNRPLVSTKIVLLK
jgi:hypothetical protein